MKLFKRISVALAFALATSGVAAVQAQPSLQGKKLAYLTLPTSNPFLAKLASTVQAEAQALGMSVTVLSSPYDAALQSQQVSDAIAQGYDALLITAASERGILPALMTAKQMKVPVFLINSPVADGNEALYESFIGENHTELGQAAGEALAKALEGRDKPKVALITGSLAEGVAPRRLAGFKEALARHPQIEVVATEDAKWDTAASERIAGQLYARFSAQGGLDAIYGMADNVAHGAILAAKTAGVALGTAPGQVIVVSSNCMKFGVDHIRQGEQYSTATQMPTRTGKAAVDTVAAHFSGKPVPKHNYLEVAVITRDNLDDYAAPCTF